MTQEELAQFIAEKWGNYSTGLAMSFVFRADKNYTQKDVKDAFSSGIYEFLQILYRNNITLNDLKIE